MKVRQSVVGWVGAVALASLGATAVTASAATDTLVTTGSPQTPGTFPQNKQNEPGLAVDPNDPTRIVAGSNDEIDNALCSDSDGDGIANNCPFTFRVGGSGVYFSLGAALGFQQPTYTGFSARQSPPGGEGKYAGPIGTVPNYYEAGLVADGDPTLAFGPRPDSGGHFSWSNGSRLYYSNLAASTATDPGRQVFEGFEAIAVSRLDDLGAGRAGGPAGKSSWSTPAIVTSGFQSANTFSDKPTVWADNAASSRFFGRVYVCYTSFKELSDDELSPIAITHSSDGGKTWTRPLVITTSGNSAKEGSFHQGCDVNTDSKGRVYAVWEGVTKDGSAQYISRSDDGGASFESPRAFAKVVDVGLPDPATGDFVFDGYAGTRTDSFPIMDVANGAPSGQAATDKLAVTWSDARAGLNHEQALVRYSSNRGTSFSEPTSVAQAGDRPDFPSIALSPNGQTAYVVYDAFTRPFRFTTGDPRPMAGVIRAGDASPGSAFVTLHRGASGDARGSSANALDSEFIGDYNWISASNTSAVAVWNDTRNADDCPAIDAYRQSLIDGSPITAPAPNTCGNRFGNTDIYAARVGAPAAAARAARRTAKTVARRGSLHAQRRPSGRLGTRR